MEKRTYFDFDKALYCLEWVHGDRYKVEEIAPNGDSWKVFEGDYPSCMNYIDEWREIYHREFFNL